MTTSRLDKRKSDLELLSPVLSQRHPLTRPAFIFVIALTLRLATAAVFFYAHGGHETIDSFDIFTESYEAVSIAQSLASGNGFSRPFWGAGPTAWLTPVMPAILAADMSIFGLHGRKPLFGFVIFNELCSALTIVPVFFAARRIVGVRGADRIAALAAWLCALDPTAGLTACKSIWYTTLAGLLAALLLWATLAIRDSEHPAAWTGYGFLWGAELLTHAAFLVLMPVALLWLFGVRRGSKRLTLPALACLTTVLCCVPWTVRNFVVLHHFVPLRSTFGFELWRFNHDGPPLHPNRHAVERDAYISLGEYAYVQEKQREAIVWISEHPGAYLRKTAERVMYFWFSVPHPLRRFMHRGMWFFNLKFLYICILLVMVLAGLVTLWRARREYFWLLASFPFIFPLVYYIALAREFHRFPINPILAVIAAFAMSRWLPNRPVGASMATSMVGQPKALEEIGKLQGIHQLREPRLASIRRTCGRFNDLLQVRPTAN